MITDCPDPAEVSTFHFLQLRTLKLEKETKNFPENVGNILSAASKYGLLFVGTEGGFRVIKLETILTIDEDKENRSSVAEYAFDFVPSGTPVILSLNSSQTILAVCVKCATNVVINLYNLSNYSGSAWQPFCTNALSPPKAEVRDFVWNPAVEGWYAVCFSDGSLQIHEVVGLSVKAIGVLQNANAVAVGWSPKGKQLVVGKDNGFFAQYKPNLSEVKSIPPPALEENPVSITSICWIANTVFAVIYAAGDSPNLFIVSTPKDSAVIYTNYYDVCLGNNSAPLQKYLLHLEPLWGILVCASLDSIEIAVLGNMPNWVQWDLREDGKALLPGKDGATHAVGMTVMYSAQRQLVISESESYPPMPVLFLLTNNGLLISFHMINANSAAPSLVCTPLPLENQSSVGSGEPVAGPSSAVFSPAPSTSNQSLMSSTFIVENQAAGDLSPAQPNKATPNVNNTQTFGRIEVSSTPAVAEPKETSSIFGDGMHMKKSDDISLNHLQKTAVSSHMTSTFTNVALSSVEKPSEVQSRTQDSYSHAIISEIQNFGRELQELKQLQISTPKIDGEEEMLSLKNSLNLQNYQKSILETMQGLNSDIHTLKNVLLESFGMVEEACSRERLRNDHSYITMLKERALDPITAKRMQKMNQHYQYLSTQLQEVSDKLDQDWINLYSNKKKSLKSNLSISSSEAIYKTIVNNRNIIHNLKKKVEILMKKSEERKLRNTTISASWGRYHKRSTQEDLSKLADEFLQVKIDKPEEGEIVVTKKLPAKSQMLLKEFLKQTNIVTVRPTAVYSPSQSRLLSNIIPSEDLDQSNEKDVSSKQSNVSTYEKEVPQLISSGEAQTPKTASNLSHSFERTPIQSASTAPIYEPITPPEVINPTVPVNKTPSNTNMHEISTANGKLPDQSLIKGAGFLDTSFINNTGQGTSSSISSNLKSPFGTSTSLGEKPLAFNSSVSSSSDTSSFLFPKTLSLNAASTQKSTETSKLPIISSNTMVSSAASSFQFSSSFGLNKDASFSITSTSNSAAITPKINAQVETKNTSENPKINLEPSAVAFSQPGSQTTTFNLPVTKTSKAPISFFAVPENKTVFSVPENKTVFSVPENKTVFSVPENKTVFSVPENKTVFSVSENKTAFSVPENKTVFSVPENKTAFSVPENKSVFSVPGNKDSSLPKSNVGFSFQKISDDVNTNPPVTILAKDTTSENSSITSTSDLPFLNQSLSKTIPVDTKSHSSSVFEVRLSDLENSAAAESTSITPTQISFGAAQKTDSTVTGNNQPTVTNTFANFTSLKQSLSSSETPTTEPAPISLAVSTPSVSEAVQSTVLDLTSSSDVTKSLSTLPLTSNVTSQPGIANSKPPTPPMPVLTPAVTTAVPLFGQNPAVSSAVSPDVTSTTEVTPSKTETTPSVFGAKPVAPVFGQSTPERPSFFGNTNVFNQTPTTQPSPFGQTVSNSSFPAATGGFFSQMPTFGSPTSATSTATTSSSDFNNQASTFSFGKPAFGQTTGSFGLAKTFFGQNTTPVTQTTSASSFSFGQNSPSMGFFSGLGGKPSEENASKNVFGLSTAKPSTDSSNLFRNSSVTSFGAVNNGSFTSPGSFSSGGGSVAQAGFGSFQQTTSPQPAGFPSPSFGGAPTFGSAPAFGASPSFGSGNALASVFGQQQVSSNFSNFANASSPTFGSLASQSPPTFGNSPQMSGFGSQGGGFGSSPVFGGNSSFGQSTSFGSPSSPPSNSSAFTQWRS